MAHLGKESANTNAIPTYVTPSMADFLSNNAPWQQLVQLNNISLQKILPKEYSEAESITLWEDLSVKIFTVPHRAEYTGK